MGIGLTVIIIIVLIVVGMSLIRDGTEAFKNSPLKSTIESSKVIVNAGIDMIKGDEEENRSLYTEIGLVPCVTNDECNILLESECLGRCMCINGVCYR